jgi:hypothetical protein
MQQQSTSTTCLQPAVECAGVDKLLTNAACCSCRLTEQVQHLLHVQSKLLQQQQQQQCQLQSEPAALLSLLQQPPQKTSAQKQQLPSSRATGAAGQELQASYLEQLLHTKLQQIEQELDAVEAEPADNLAVAPAAESGPEQAQEQHTGSQPHPEQSQQQQQQLLLQEAVIQEQSATINDLKQAIAGELQTHTCDYFWCLIVRQLSCQLCCGVAAALQPNQKCFDAHRTHQKRWEASMSCL